MSKKAFYILGMAITIILGTFFYLKFCCSCYVKSTAIDTEKASIRAATDIDFAPFVLNGSGIEFQTSQNLKFLKSSSDIIMPIQDSVAIGIEKMKALLLLNPKQKVTITGYAASDEINTTQFENLGLARAYSIKTFFVSKGLPENLIGLKGEIVENWKMKADTLLGPAEYTFESLGSRSASDEWSLLKEKINANPLILHFNTNQITDNLTAEESQKVADIAQYMKNVDDASLLVVGHTDDVGNRDSNIILGEKRAEFTKSYLSKNGIETNRIKTVSKGPDEPIGENTTAKGKANNRRTVITIQ